MNNKKQCPDCGRHFSERLIRFPVFLDSKDETDVYMICPICSFEKRTKEEQQSLSAHSKDLYKAALLEVEESGQYEKSPLPNDKIKWERLTKLTPEEHDKVIKSHPEIEEEEKN